MALMRALDTGGDAELRCYGKIASNVFAALAFALACGAPRWFGDSKWTARCWQRRSHDRRESHNYAKSVQYQKWMRHEIVSQFIYYSSGGESYRNKTNNFMTYLMH